MPLFKYQTDGTEEPGRGSHSRSNNGSHMYMIEGDGEDEDYDMQAAMEVEQADHEDQWQPHYHLFEGNEPPKASSSRAASLPKQQQQQQRASSSKQQASKSNGKAREVFDIDDDEDEGMEEMIPVPIDAKGAIVSDARIEEISREIDSIDEQIASLKAARAILAEDRQTLFNRQRAAQSTLREKERQVNYTKPLPTAGIVNYGDSSKFAWKKKLDGILDRVFGIKKLRLCQEGVLNAVLDGRDVICIMPTGGGKSVCFQAPALMSRGVTLVISPLLSLMTDQVLALNAKGVDAVMITGSTPHNEIKDITERLTSKDGSIKLCYVTPEKLAKSKTFANTLGKMYSAGLLARIAIDESHCCSQMGHDFRPDYKRLSMLKQLYPKTPIIALTATCGKAVLNDVVRILHLKSCTSGESAESNKTVFFSAPLYRPNLHYSTRIKPVQAPNLASEMADLILQRYPNSAGIIYCLSQKETETFAQAIREYSEGKIKIGTYHAGMSDYDKESIHTRWREGRIKCVVATIAFGMGIDAPDVRYVFHQTISKSMEGYYQETGRAGRDGKDSDCILWFRPADASRLSTLTLGEVEGQKKLHNMLKYALDFKSCRKLLFDSYFGNPANVVAPYAESDRSTCGHCDNCIRAKRVTSNDEASSSKGKKAANEESEAEADSAVVEYARKQQVVTKDVTLEAWKICKIIKAADSLSSRITLPGATDLCRGLSKSTFPTKNKDVKASLDLNKICNGKIMTINKDDMEILLLDLLMKGYLKEEFVQTAYTINSYITTGPQSIRLTRLKEEQVTESGIKIELSTLATVKAATKGKGKKKDSDDENEEDDEEGVAGDDIEKTKKAKPKRKRKNSKDIASEWVTDASKTGSRGKKKATATNGDDQKETSKSSSKAKSKTAEKAPPAKKKRAVTATDSDDDWEDFGLAPTLPKTKAKQQGISKQGDGSEEDDMGLDTDIGKELPDIGVYDEETEEEEGSLAYPFMRDRYSKNRERGRSQDKEQTQSASSRAASAALNRASGSGHIIDLDASYN